MLFTSFRRKSNNEVIYLDSAQIMFAIADAPGNEDQPIGVGLQVRGQRNIDGDVAGTYKAAKTTLTAALPSAIELPAMSSTEQGKASANRITRLALVNPAHVRDVRPFGRDACEVSFAGCDTLLVVNSTAAIVVAQFGV